MSPMEQLAKQEYERGYSDGKSDYFAAGVAEGEMRARQRMIANRVVANQHPFAAPGKPIDHIAGAGNMIAEPVKQEQVGSLEIAYGREPEIYATPNAEDLPEGTYRLYAAPVQPVKQEPVAWTNYNGAVNNRLKGAPVDAKAIRAEALEEAAKFAYDLRFRCCWTAEAIAAAIRGMK